MVVLPPADPNLIAPLHIGAILPGWSKFFIMLLHSAGSGLPSDNTRVHTFLAANAMH